MMRRMILFGDIVVFDLKDGNKIAPAAAALRLSISLRVKLDGMISMSKLGSEKELGIRNLLAESQVGN